MHALLVAASGLLLLALPLCTTAGKVSSFKPAKFIPGEHPSPSELTINSVYNNKTNFLERFTEQFYCGFVDGIGEVHYFEKGSEDGHVQELCRQIVRHCQRETTKFCAGQDVCSKMDQDQLGNTCFFKALPDNPGFYENLMQRISTDGANLGHKQCLVHKLIEPYVLAEDLPFFLCLADEKSRFSTKGTGSGHWNQNVFGLFGLGSEDGWCNGDAPSKHDIEYCEMDCSQSENYNLKDDFYCAFRVLAINGLTGGFGEGVHSKCCDEGVLERYSSYQLCKSNYDADSIYKNKSPATPILCTGYYDRDQLNYTKHIMSKAEAAPLPTGLETTPMKFYLNLFGDNEPVVAPSPLIKGDELKRSRRTAQSVLDLMEAESIVSPRTGKSINSSTRRKSGKSIARKGRAHLTDERIQRIVDICENYDVGSLKRSTEEYNEESDDDYYPGADDDEDYYELGDNERSFDAEVTYPRSGRSHVSYTEEDDDQYYDDHGDRESNKPRFGQGQQHQPRFGRTRTYHDSDADESKGSQNVPDVRDEDLVERKRRSPAGVYYEKEKCAIIVNPEKKAAYKGKVCSDDRIAAFLQEDDWNGVPLDY